MRFAHILLSATVARAATVMFLVECSGNTDYLIDGKLDPTLTVAENDEVTFAIGDSCSAHPFQLLDADGTPIEPTSTIGSTSNVTWTVPPGAATYQYVCTSHAEMTSTITATGPPPAVILDFSALAESTTSAALAWASDQQNGCTFESWAVKAINANNQSMDALGCQSLLEAQTTCSASGLIEGASYWFSVQLICQEAKLSSAVLTSSLVSLAPASPIGSVTAKVVSATSATLTWTSATSLGACVLSSYEVMTSNDETVQGCTAVNKNTSCTATGLVPSTNYSFTVKTICSKLAFNSNVSLSNSITTLAPVVFNVTCEGTTAFKINGVANANVTIIQGDVLIFRIDTSCASSPFGIANVDGSAYASGVTATSDSVQVETSDSTPTMLRYLSTQQGQPSMTGLIIVKRPPTKAGRPVISVSRDTDTPTVAISWTAGSDGDCVFSTWLVQDETGAPVEGCKNFTAATVTKCTATGLAGATEYRFTVQRVCKDPLANSPVSDLSSSVTTISTVGIKICQGGGTCNCGNATICTCQLTDVCNCDFADKCICQGGKCNGGNANLMICQSTDCNKECAKSCPTCLGDAISGLFGSKSCVSSSIAVSASGLLLAALSLFVF